MGISNVFSNYFSSIANKTKLDDDFFIFLKNTSNISFFASLTEKTEM